MDDVLQNLIKANLEKKSKRRVELEPGDLSSESASEIIRALEAKDNRALAHALKNFVQASRE